MKGIDQYAGETFPDEELEKRYQRYREIIKKFTLMSDTFMRNIFKHIECVEYVLQVIMVNGRYLVPVQIWSKPV